MLIATKLRTMEHYKLGIGSYSFKLFNGFFHGLFKFSMTLGLVKVFESDKFNLSLSKTFTVFLVWGYFLTLSNSTDTDSGVYQNGCHLHCLITPLYFTLSLLRHLQ